MQTQAVDFDIDQFDCVTFVVDATGLTNPTFTAYDAGPLYVLAIFLDQDIIKPGKNVSDGALITLLLKNRTGFQVSGDVSITVESGESAPPE